MLIEESDYQQLSEALAMEKLLRKAEDDIKNNRFTEAETFFREFRRDKKI